jgi:Lon protease-like protein
VTALLPIFPLPQVVLFPRVRCPLHIFEPRYRQMAEAALAGDGRIGMVTVRPQHLSEMSGDPPVFDIGCAGRISEHRRHEDGRFDIVLIGEERFRILDEPPRDSEVLYRAARTEPLSEIVEAEDAVRLRTLRASALEHLTRLVTRSSDGKRRFDASIFSDMDDVTVANALCQVLDLGALEKQSLLEEDRVASRLDQLVALLEFRLAELGAEVDDPTRTIH